MSQMILLLGISGMAWTGEVEPRFASARPTWPAGREQEMNLLVGFRAVVAPPAGERVLVRVTASCVYRAFVNGQFAGHGPARGPHGYFRVDEWDVSNRLRPGRNTIAIEVAGYNVDSYYLLNQPSFLQAEVVAGAKVLAATGDPSDGFEAFLLTERVQKVQRYSTQRTFTEVYRRAQDCDAWRLKGSHERTPVACAVSADRRLLPRRVPQADFACRPPARQVSSGRLVPAAAVKDEKELQAFMGMGLNRGGFPVESLEATPVVELSKTAAGHVTPVDRPWSPTAALDLPGGSFHLLDMGTNLTGFIGFQAKCRTKTRLYVTFGEILTDGDVDLRRGACASVIAYELEPGEHVIESFEPYTLKYLRFTVLDGECSVDRVYLREYANPDVWRAHFSSSDERLNRLFAAARETFRQNAVDIFMDCPLRERAGWLCDSFFTARVAADLSGNTLIERNFYENFLLPGRFARLPEGMLPMCYPADHLPDSFIPNWAMWFVVELEEYLQRSGDRATVDALEPKVMALFDYFKPFRNPDGLLAKLESWVFVEWSAANRFVQDVNYPTNMLYAGALAAAGRLYGRGDLTAEADRIRDVIRRQSFDGEFFVDNAIITDSGLKVTDNRTETCQYYAFFFNVATPETHGDLWRKLSDQFGPKRGETKAFPEIHVSNAFIGNVLRLEILSGYGRCRQLLDEAIDYHLYMADRTGTLWENVDPGASCNHGFASHLAHVLYRDVLGIHRIEPIARSVHLRFTEMPLSWCQGRIPVGDGFVSLAWHKEQGGLVYRVDVPAGYEVRVENLTGAKLRREP